MSRSLLLAAIGACVLTAALQPPAWALFRGDEYEPRDWDPDTEYFLDRLSFLPDYETELRYRSARNAYLLAAGSVTSDDMFLWQRLKFEAELDPTWSVLFRSEMNQDFDGIFEHYLVGFDAELAGGWHWQIVGEPLARKEFSDTGFAFWRGGDSGRFRAQFLWPDIFFDGKNELSAELVRRPFNLQLSCRADVTPGLELRFGADLDFPNEIDYGRPAFSFEFEKHQASMGATWRIDELQTVVLDLEGELAEKELSGDVAADPRDFVTDREYFDGRVEYIHGFESGTRLAVGYEHVRFDEANRFPNDPSKTFRIDRIDRIAYASWTHPFSKKALFTTGVYVDWVDHREIYPNGPGDGKTFDGVESKVAFRLEFVGERHRVTLGPSFELDRWGFGGGFANIYVEF